tara:strand:- start:8549 stop:9994 length:1446 start_codon:yes stop_codon:yes gene_type:complete
MANKARRKRKKREVARSTELEADLSSLNYSVAGVGENGEKFIPNLMNEAKTLTSLQRLGYQACPAISDIIDNALDNNATVVDVTVNSGADDGAYGELSSVYFCDNGDGMGEERLINALAIGSISIKGADFGKYGLGMITGGISLGNTIRVFSRPRSGAGSGYVFRGVLDLLQVKENDAPEKLRSVGRATADEVKFFEKHLRKATGSPIGSGTLVTVSSLVNREYRAQMPLVNKLRKTLGYVYRKLINNDNISLYVNEQLIKAVDPVNDYPLRNKETKVIDCGEGKITLNMVEIQSHVDKKKSKAKDIGMETRGFHVLRNDRGICGPLQFGLLGKDHEHHHFRCELCFGTELDDILSVPLQKNKIILPADVKEDIQAAIASFIESVRAYTVGIRVKRLALRRQNEVLPISDSGSKPDSKVKVGFDAMLCSFASTSLPDKLKDGLEMVLENWGDLPEEVQTSVVKKSERCLKGVISIVESCLE